MFSLEGNLAILDTKNRLAPLAVVTKTKRRTNVAAAMLLEYSLPLSSSSLNTYSQIFPTNSYEHY